MPGGSVVIVRDDERLERMRAAEYRTMIMNPDLADGGREMTDVAFERHDNGLDELSVTW
jgi:hypothetical protein